MSEPSEPPRSNVRTRVVHAGVTDVGRQRKHNEDCVLLRPEHGLYCVADGMGGHNAGDVASKLVTTSLGNFYEATASVSQAPPAFDLPDDYAKIHPEARRIAAGVRKANHDVFTISNTHAQHHGMGSTCVAIHVTNGMAHIAHVGDSRCYRIRDGQIQQMTRDHSLINDALDMKPDLTKEELARLPKNIITRALGMKDVVKVDIRTEVVLPGDTFLLCSDGLTGMVPVPQILEVVGLTSEPQEACELLIAEANDAGGTDNISAVLVRVEEEAAAPVSDGVIEAHTELVEDDVEEVAADDVQVEAVAEEIHEEVDADALLEDDPATHPFLIEDEPPTRPFQIADAHTEPFPSVLESGPPPRAAPSLPPSGPKPRPYADPYFDGPASSPAAWGSFEADADAEDDPATRPFQQTEAEQIDAARRATELAYLAARQAEEASPELSAEPLSDDFDAAELAAVLAEGGEIDLDLRGPWPSKVAVRRCPRCRYELFPGNRFCVECGARIESAAV
jgi:PPM family protein phosphatase